MESTTHLERQGALHAAFLEHCAGSGHGFGFTRDHDLRRAVVVRGHHGAGGLAAHFLDQCGLGRAADDSGHRTGDGLTAALHGVGTDGNQTDALLEGEGAGSYEGGEFAERVAGDHVGMDIGCQGEGHGMQEDGGLRHFRGLEVFVAAAEHDLTQAEAQDAVGGVEQVAGLRVAHIELLPHANELGTLSRKHICCFHTIAFYT